jgi:signal transduction histidine kinase
VPLRLRLLLYFITIAIVPLTLFALIAWSTSNANLSLLERDALDSGLDSGGRVLAQNVDNLVRVTRDYAYWDELHNQVGKGALDPDWLAGNFDPATVTSPINTFSLDVLGVWTQDKQSLYAYGPAAAMFSKVDPAILDSVFKSEEPGRIYVPFTTPAASTGAASGPAVYLVTVAAVRDGVGANPNGYMMMARRLGAADVAAIQSLTGYNAALYVGTATLAASNADLPAPLATDLQAIGGDGSRRFEQDRPDYSLGYSAVRSTDGTQVASLVMWRPRTVVQTANTVLRNTLAIVFAIGALLAIVVAAVFGRSISRPLTAMAAITDRVSAGDLAQRIAIEHLPPDELRQLATAFNHMTGQLAQTIDALNGKVVQVNEANQALKVATAKAQELARLRGEFLSTMSHELRTPLNAIIGFTDVLLMGVSGPINAAQKSQLNRLKDNARRLLGLINDVLDISRIDAGRIELVSEPYSPADLLSRVSSQVRVLGEEKQLTYTTDITPDLPPLIVGDEKRLEQIIVNLLSNAFKFTEKGGVTLTVRTDPDRNQWTVAVQDTGIGIPPHAFDLVFEPFRQVDGSSKRVYKGSGLGLAIAQQLALLMGGKITLNSTVGVGSTFTITLPITTPTADLSNDALSDLAAHRPLLQKAGI